jgi:hypothetical protein
VTASSPQLAQQVAETAESLRHNLAMDWLGHELPPWRDKCPITVNAGSHLGAGGVTQFMFQNGQPFGWTMSVQGSAERILDSVLPHEITHTVFATHFGRPLPRWADEGASTTVEHVAETSKQDRLLIEFLTTDRGIAFNNMFAMTEYPRDILPLYAQGHSLARFLLAQGGKRKFVNYVGDGMKWNSWTKATQKHYGFQNLSELQVNWLDWVRHGGGPVTAPNTLVAQASTTNSNDPSPVASTPSPSGSRSPDVGNVVAASFERPSQGTPAAGWYARVRDETRRQPSPESATSSASTRASASGVPSASTGASHANSNQSGRSSRSEQTVSRPQPPARAEQVVLQWTQPSTSQRPLAPNTPSPRQAEQPGKTPPGSSYLVSPQELRGTILR